MTWARAAIFWGSDYGRDLLQNAGYSESVATVAPPLVVSTMVQVANQPLIRATITLQNPQLETPLRNVMEAVRWLYGHKGLNSLWHGTTVGCFKTVPKYCTAVVVKDYMDEHVLPPALPSSPTSQYDVLERSALKSVSAGVVGAVLTNPLDVIRNEMFKTHHGMFRTIRDLQAELGTWGWLTRGLGRNLVAVHTVGKPCNRKDIAKLVGRGSVGQGS